MDKEYSTEGLLFQWFIARFSKHGQPEWIEKAENNNNLQAGINKGFKSGQMSLLGFNKHEDLSLFEKTIDTLARGNFRMKLFDCEYIDNPKLLEDTVFCGSGKLDAGDNFVSYKWNGTAGGQFFEVQQSGTIYLEATDSMGCMIYDSAYVEVLPEFEISIIGNDKICPQEGSAMLMIDGDVTEASITWCTGDTDPVIFVNQKGDYHVEAINNNGCYDEASFSVSHYEITPPNLSEYYMINPDETLELYPGNYVSYYWTGGYQDSVLVIDGSEYGTGIYDFELDVIDYNSCLVNHEFTVDIFGRSNGSKTINNDPGSYQNDTTTMQNDYLQPDACDFLIYPNPGYDPFYISIMPGAIKNNHQDSEFYNIETTIWNMKGELVYYKKLPKNTNHYKINNTGLKPGKYIIKLIYNNRICEIKKFVVL